jgi:predicted phage terminase large subunit-like protein
MSHQDRELLQAVLRHDFQSFLHRSMLTLNPGTKFLPNWHIDAITHQLQRISRGENTRLIINMPPRHLKSTILVAFVAHVLGLNPRRRVISVSYGTELSLKHSADFRAIVESNWYRSVFPKVSFTKVTDAEVHTSERGFRKATSVNAALTGFGGDLFIIDDPQKPQDAQSDLQRSQLNHWFSNTLMSRLDNKETSAIVVVMQRVHMHDLTGYLQESGNWFVLSLPAVAESEETVRVREKSLHRRQAGEALHPERESIETLERLRQELGPDVFAAQYQQRPVPAGGQLIKRDWLRYYDQLPERDYAVTVIQSWDTAAKDGPNNSWSVCTTWFLHNKHYYLLDVSRGRYDYPRLRATALALAERWEPDVVLIEDASIGSALAQELTEELSVRVSLVPVEHNKIARLFVQQGKFSAGRVLFPHGASFLQDLEMELLTFPQSKTDDQVDSLTQALAYDDSSYDESMSWVDAD